MIRSKAGGNLDVRIETAKTSLASSSANSAAKDIAPVRNAIGGARQKMEEWRRDYNEVQPHSAVGNKPPISLMNGSGASHPHEPEPENTPARAV